VITSRWSAGTAIPWLYRANGGRIDEGDSARMVIFLNEKMADGHP
jgi:hypothetical protein